MTNCCRKCAKLMCEKRDQIEDCKECVSYVWLELQRLDKIIEEEDNNFWKKLLN